MCFECRREWNWRWHKKEKEESQLWMSVVWDYGKIAAAAAKSLQSCPTLCDPIDGSPLGSPVPGILQARTLEWVAISFSKLAWRLQSNWRHRNILTDITETQAHRRDSFWEGHFHFNTVTDQIISKHFQSSMHKKLEKIWNIDFSAHLSWKKIIEMSVPKGT